MLTAARRVLAPGWKVTCVLGIGGVLGVFWGCFGVFCGCGCVMVWCSVYIQYKHTYISSTYTSHVYISSVIDAQYHTHLEHGCWVQCMRSVVHYWSLCHIGKTGDV